MPERTADLALTGRLLVWTARHWARAHSHRRDLPGFVLHTVRQLPAGEQVLPALEAWLAILALGARQPLCFAAPEAAALTRDERVLLLALMAAGCGLDDEIRPLLADLQDAGGLRGAQDSTRALGRLLEANSLPLTRRQGWLREPLAGTQDAARHGPERHGGYAVNTPQRALAQNPSCHRSSRFVHK